MSSVEFVSNMLNYLLSKKHGDTVFVKGDWGTGKTHFWKNYISGMETEGKYVYISLFGVQGIEEIKKKLLSGFLIDTKKKKNNIFKKILSNINIPQIISSVSGVQIEVDWIEVLGENHIVCFDDLERVSPSTNIETILGFINYLSEHKKYKCIVIYNEDRMCQSHKDGLGLMQDKLGFSKITFLPNLNDRFQEICTKYSLDNEQVCSTFLDAFILAEITNLRVIDRCIEVYTLLNKELGDVGLPESAIHFIIAMIDAGAHMKVEEMDLHVMSPFSSLIDENDSDLEKMQKRFLSKYYSQEANVNYNFYNSIYSFIQLGFVNSSFLKEEFLGGDDGIRLETKDILKLREVHLFFKTEVELREIKEFILNTIKIQRDYSKFEIEILIRTLSSVISLTETSWPLSLPDELILILKKYYSNLDNLDSINDKIEFFGSDVIVSFIRHIKDIETTEAIKRARDQLEYEFKNKCSLSKESRTVITRGSMVFMEIDLKAYLDKLYESDTSIENKFNFLIFIGEVLKSNSSLQGELGVLVNHLTNVYIDTSSVMEQLRYYRILENLNAKPAVKPKNLY